MSPRKRHTLSIDADVPPELSNAEFRTSQVEGFHRCPSAFHIDPSGILKIGGT